MGSKTATAERNRERAAKTEALMKNIMAPGAGEISKAREAELQRAANYGRGVQFIEPNPYVKGLTQKGGQPVLNPNGSFTGRITATAPTFGEAGKDIVRGLLGGKAEAPSYIYSPTTLPGTPTSTFRQYAPQPEEVRGLIPAVAEKFMVPGGIMFGIAKDLYQKYFPGQQDDTQPIVDLRKPTIEEQVTTYVGGDPYIQKRNTLKQIIAQSQAPGASELNVDEMSDQEVDLRLKSYGQGFAMGGLTRTIPPESGPKPQGIASLYKNK